MSRTYRLVKYKDGKPIYTKHENKYPPYKWWTTECKEVRKHLWRSYRHKCKVWLKKYGYIPKWYNSNGWNTW